MPSSYSRCDVADRLKARRETLLTGRPAPRLGNGKGTLVALHGTDRARREVERLVSVAAEVPSDFRPRADVLVAVARFVTARETQKTDR